MFSLINVASEHGSRRARTSSRRFPVSPRMILAVCSTVSNDDSVSSVLVELSVALRLFRGPSMIVTSKVRFPVVSCIKV